MPPETRFLLPVYRARNSFGDLTLRRHRLALGRRITRRGNFSHLELDRRAVVRAIADGPPSVGSALAIVWREFARSRGKARWGEKRPMYWQHMEWVLRLFPDAQVVHLIRDPRACIASLQSVHWWNGGFDGAVATWALADQELRRFGRGVPADSYHALYYEDLMHDPRAVLERLCTFLCEDFDEGMLEYSAAAGDIVPARKTWHALTHRPLDPSRTEGWRRTLTRDEIALIESVLRGPMRRHGYEPAGTGGRARAADIARYELERTRRLVRMRAIHAADRMQRRHELQPVAADPSLSAPR